MNCTPNVKCKTLKHLQENVGENSGNLGFAEFFRQNTKSMIQERKKN